MPLPLLLLGGGLAGAYVLSRAGASAPASPVSPPKAPPTTADPLVGKIYLTFYKYLGNRYFETLSADGLMSAGPFAVDELADQRKRIALCTAAHLPLSTQDSDALALQRAAAAQAGF